MPDTVVEDSAPTGGRFAREFARAARNIQRQHARRIPEFEGSIRARISPGHPFLRYGSARVFLARRAGRPVGTAVASIHPSMEAGAIGSFEAVDETAADVLLTAAQNWLAARGQARAVGPMTFSSWYAYRLRTRADEGYDFLLEPDTPAEYAAWWRSAGFTAEEAYFSSRAERTEDAERRLLEQRQRLADSDLLVRELDLGNFESELRIFHRLSGDGFSNPWFVPIDFEEFRALYAAARRLVDPRFVLLAETPEGEPVGLAFAVPNRYRAVAAMRGSSSPLAKLRYVRDRAAVDGLIVKTLLTSSDFHGQGIGTGLLAEVQGRGWDAGMGIFHCTMHADNPTRKMSERFGGRVIREYELLSRELEAPA